MNFLPALALAIISLWLWSALKRLTLHLAIAILDLLIIAVKFAQLIYSFAFVRFGVHSHRT